MRLPGSVSANKNSGYGHRTGRQQRRSSERQGAPSRPAAPPSPPASSKANGGIWGRRRFGGGAVGGPVVRRCGSGCRRCLGRLRLYSLQGWDSRCSCRRESASRRALPLPVFGCRYGCGFQLPVFPRPPGQPALPAAGDRIHRAPDRAAERFALISLQTLGKTPLAAPGV